MSTKRVSSKIKQKQTQTKLLEQQTKKMEQKLAALKQQVQQQKKLKQTTGFQSTLTKWRKITGETSLKGYAKKVLADRKQALNKYGIDEKKITGVKSFEPALSKIRAERTEKEEKNLTKIPKFQFKSMMETKKQQVNQLPVQSIQNNFFKAKINTKQIVRRKSLQEFLQQHFLQQYFSVLKANNINEIDDLYHISKQKMTELGIAPGHQAKIIKRVKEEIQGKAKTKNTDKTQKTAIEQFSGQKISFGYGEGDVSAYQEINKQQEQAKMIQEHKMNENFNQKSDLGGYQDQDESEYDEEEEDDEVILTIPAMTQFSLQTNAADDGLNYLNNTEFNCFQCYRKGNNQPLGSTDGRLFCNQECLNKYLRFMQKKCPECEQIFYKFNGYFDDGLWFCSIKCSPNREKIQEMFIQWSNRPSQLQ